jgi:hypothetical protein
MVKREVSNQSHMDGVIEKVILEFIRQLAPVVEIWMMTRMLSSSLDSFHDTLQSRNSHVRIDDFLSC